MRDEHQSQARTNECQCVRCSRQSASRAGPTVTRTAHKTDNASTQLGKSSPTVETEEVGALGFH